MSCSARAGLPGSGYQRIPAWTSVSALGRGHQPGEHGAADVGLEELGALEVDGGGGRVDADDALDAGLALQPQGQLGPPVATDAGDQDAAALGQPSATPNPLAQAVQQGLPSASTSALVLTRRSRLPGRVRRPSSASSAIEDRIRAPVIGAAAEVADRLGEAVRWPPRCAAPPRRGRLVPRRTTSSSRSGPARGSPVAESAVAASVRSTAARRASPTPRLPGSLLSSRSIYPWGA